MTLHLRVYSGLSVAHNVIAMVFKSGKSKQK
jgi:hypothetical protein